MWKIIFDLITNLFKQEVKPKPTIPVSKKDFGKKAGELAAKYENPSKGPGYISNGSSWGDPGGDSYGSYQIETKKGTMRDYLSTNDKYTQTLNKYAINSIGFKNAWRKLAIEDPEGFEESQFQFLASKSGGYYDALKYAEKLGWSTSNLAMQSAIFSTSNQSGGWRHGIFDKTGIKPTDTLEVQINKLYDARAKYFLSLHLDISIKVAIMKSRCGVDYNLNKVKTPNERLDCLKLITPQLF